MSAAGWPSRERRLAVDGTASLVESRPSVSAVVRTQGVSGPSALLIASLRRGSQVTPFFIGLAALGDEIQDLNLSVVLINDAPEDEALGEALRAELPLLAGRMKVSIFTNTHSPGPVGAANHGLRMALALGCDAILWNPETELLPGVLREVVAVSKLESAHLGRQPAIEHWVDLRFTPLETGSEAGSRQGGRGSPGLFGAPAADHLHAHQRWPLLLHPPSHAGGVRRIRPGLRR